LIRGQSLPRHNSQTDTITNTSLQSAASWGGTTVPGCEQSEEAYSNLHTEMRQTALRSLYKLVTAASGEDHLMPCKSGRTHDRIWPIRFTHRFVCTQGDPAHTAKTMVVGCHKIEAQINTRVAESHRMLQIGNKTFWPTAFTARRAISNPCDGQKLNIWRSLLKKNFSFESLLLRRNFYAKLSKQQTLVMGFWRRGPLKGLFDIPQWGNVYVLREKKCSAVGDCEVAVWDCDLKSTRNKRTALWLRAWENN
jgi:hypothetical protein